MQKFILISIVLSVFSLVSCEMVNADPDPMTVQVVDGPSTRSSVEEYTELSSDRRYCAEDFQNNAYYFKYNDNYYPIIGYDVWDNYCVMFSEVTRLWWAYFDTEDGSRYFLTYDYDTNTSTLQKAHEKRKSLPVNTYDDYFPMNTTVGTIWPTTRKTCLITWVGTLYVLNDVE